MGLAAAKNKRRLGNDPNNTKWSRNTDSFGQKLLRAQGWEPGQYLGAKDAAHAEWHTEANSSHIRVVLKDDTMGLGAKRNTGDECTGLNAFQNLLGRLNGKSEDVIEAEQQARDDVKRNLYVEQKIGTIRFVKGGWLVGDVVKETLAEEDEGLPPSGSKQDSAATSSAEDTSKSEKKSKKRKAEKEGDDKASKKDKKSKKRKSEDDVDSDDSRSKKKAKKSKKSKKDDEAEAANDPDGATTSAVESKNSRKEKKEKKESKEEKREKKEKRRKEKASSSGSGTETGDSISREKKRRKGGKKDEASESPAPATQPTVSASGTSTPAGSGYSTPTISDSTSARYLSRRRFIAQKTMAFSDATALNQIFMIKS
ncbi:Protein PXR1 [Rhypophila decipiens]